MGMYDIGSFLGFYPLIPYSEPLSYSVWCFAHTLDPKLLRPNTAAGERLHLRLRHCLAANHRIAYYGLGCKVTVPYMVVSRNSRTPI